MWPPETGRVHPEKCVAVASEGDRKTDSAAGQTEARGQSQCAELCPRVWGMPLLFSLACTALGRSDVRSTSSVLELRSEQQPRRQAFLMSHPRTLTTFGLGNVLLESQAWPGLYGDAESVHTRVDGGCPGPAGRL